MNHGRLGACVDISGILVRMLEREGIWSCTITGSLTITFPPISELESKFFWSIDKGNFVAGHAWVFAPPYTVVDIAIKQQDFSREERLHLPEMVLSQSKTPVGVEVNEIISPIARQVLKSHGIPEDNQLSACLPYFPEIFDCFPAIVEHCPNGSQLK